MADTSSTRATQPGDRSDDPTPTPAPSLAASLPPNPTTTATSEPTATDDAALLAHVQSVWDRIRPNSTIYRLLLSDVVLVSARPGRFVARLALQPVHLNSNQTLHGAVSAAIVDWAGGMAIATTGRAKTGVSTDIHVTYASAARLGDTIEIDARANRVGRNLGFTTVEIRKLPAADGGEATVVCTGSHTKYVNI
ncbi:hypothetical protein VTK73DRAFT_6259 [Phialemonium thermophilum]|uniref:Thioesterase domain-containing protein n=1 Tax=Phialemonium thermophilum TaxID=223376 RepID=A0ABR3WK70_9PEZI